MTHHNLITLGQCLVALARQGVKAPLYRVLKFIEAGAVVSIFRPQPALPSSQTQKKDAPKLRVNLSKATSILKQINTTFSELPTSVTLPIQSKQIDPISLSQLLDQLQTNIQSFFQPSELLSLPPPPPLDTSQFSSQVLPELVPMLQTCRRPTLDDFRKKPLYLMLQYPIKLTDDEFVKLEDSINFEFNQQKHLFQDDYDNVSNLLLSSFDYYCFQFDCLRRTPGYRSIATSRTSEFLTTVIWSTLGPDRHKFVFQFENGNIYIDLVSNPNRFF